MASFMCCFPVSHVLPLLIISITWESPSSAFTRHTQPSAAQLRLHHRLPGAACPASPPPPAAPRPCPLLCSEPVTCAPPRCAACSRHPGPCRRGHRCPPCGAHVPGGRALAWRRPRCRPPPGQCWMPPPRLTGSWCGEPQRLSEARRRPQLYAPGRGLCGHRRPVRPFLGSQAEAAVDATPSVTSQGALGLRFNSRAHGLPSCGCCTEVSRPGSSLPSPWAAPCSIILLLSGCRPLCVFTGATGQCCAHLPLSPGTSAPPAWPWGSLW